MSWFLGPLLGRHEATGASLHVGRSRSDLVVDLWPAIAGLGVVLGAICGRFGADLGSTQADMGVIWVDLGFISGSLLRRSGVLRSFRG